MAHVGKWAWAKYEMIIMEKLLELYKQWNGAEPAHVQQIPGGGSNRTYFRLTDQQGQSVIGDRKSVV